jgi:hypothetical protein
MSVHAILTDKSHALRRSLLILHGVGLFLILLGGFAMLAKLGIGWPLPLWITSKVIIWIVFSGLIAVLYKKDILNRTIWVLVPMLFLFAWYLASFKPW